MADKKKPAGKVTSKLKGKKAAIVVSKTARPLTKVEIDHQADVAVAHLNVYADEMSKKLLQIGEYLFDEVFGWPTGTPVTVLVDPEGKVDECSEKGTVELVLVPSPCR